LNINDFDRLYRRRKTGAGLTGSVVRISLKPLGPKKLRVLTNVTVENITSAYTKLRLGVKNSGLEMYLEEQQTVSAGELVSSRADVLLTEGDTFFADLTGTTDGDHIIFVCQGWEQKI
jgi:hypothetical protein